MNESKEILCTESYQLWANFTAGDPTSLQGEQRWRAGSMLELAVYADTAHGA